MSDSLWLQELQPARLLCPWGSLGKRSGVACHVLPPEDLPESGTESVSPALAGRFITTVPSGKSNLFSWVGLRKILGKWHGRCGCLDVETWSSLGRAAAVLVYSAAAQLGLTLIYSENSTREACWLSVCSRYSYIYGIVNLRPSRTLKGKAWRVFWAKPQADTFSIQQIILLSAMNEQVLRRRAWGIWHRGVREILFSCPRWQLTASLRELLTTIVRWGKCENKVNQKRNRNPDLSVPVYPIFNLNISVALFLASLALLEIHTHTWLSKSLGDTEEVGPPPGEGSTASCVGREPCPHWRA